MSKLRVVVAEPGKPAEIREIDGSFEAMRAIVGGYLECLPIWSGYDVWINEEGKLLGLEPNRLLATGRCDGSAWDVVGTLFVADNEDGETVSLSVEAAEALVVALNAKASDRSGLCRPLLASEVQEPSFTVSEWKDE